MVKSFDTSTDANPNLKLMTTEETWNSVEGEEGWRGEKRNATYQQGDDKGPSFHSVSMYGKEVGSIARKGSQLRSCINS